MNCESWEELYKTKLAGAARLFAAGEEITIFTVGGVKAGP